MSVALERAIVDLQQQADDIQTQIYILSGVLGASVIFLILAATILSVIGYNLTKQLKENTRRRQVDEEMNKRRFSAYTGEEVQRQLTAATISAAIPLPSFQGSNSPSVVDASNVPVVQEYAFNTPHQGGHGVFTLQNPRTNF